MLRKSGVSTMVAMLSLALGIGATTAIFSVVNAVLLEPFPYRDAGRIMCMDIGTAKGVWRNAHSISEYLDIRDQNHVFESVAAALYQDMVLTGGAEPEPLQARFVSANTFPMLEVAPLIGRSILPEDDRAGSASPHVAVIGYSLWRRVFNSEPAVLGRTIRLNDESYTVVGVMPPRFTWRSGDVWLPLPLDRGLAGNGRLISIRARLKPGISPEQASAEMQTIHARLAKQYPRMYPPDKITVSVYSLIDNGTRSFRSTLYILLSAVGFLLLIACGNAANLLLARATARQKEIAIRVSVGASRGRIIRQLLTESVLLALAGGILGVVLAYWGVDLLVSLIPPSTIPGEVAIHINARVLAFSLAASVLTGLLFGLAPAVQASRPDLNESLKDAGKGSGGGVGAGYTRNVLVVAGVALSLMLLVGAGLMMRSFSTLYRMETVPHPENVLTLRITLPIVRYRTPEQRNGFFTDLQRRVRMLPGVEAATVSNGLPPWGARDSAFDIDGHPHSEDWWMEFQPVGVDYFRAIGIPLLRGRQITEEDVVYSGHVAVISELMAARHWPAGEDPIGKRIRLAALPGGRPPSVGDPWVRIVGVVGNVRNSGPREPIRPVAYVPFTLIAPPQRVVALRTQAGAMRLLKSVRGEVSAIDRDQPITNAMTLEDSMIQERAQPRFSMVLFGAFAAVGLALASAGIYSLMAYNVSRRTHEIGIRLALGANNGDVVWLVLSQGLKLVLAGALGGLLGSFALTRLLASQLYGITATDPATFIGVMAVLGVVAMAACHFPARKATGVDPLTALRCE